MSGKLAWLGPINCHWPKEGLSSAGPADDVPIDERGPLVFPADDVPIDEPGPLVLTGCVDIDIALTFLKLAIALRVAVMGTSFAGYARWA